MNVATALRAEISRIARKELRSETDRLKKSVSTYRREIAALKKRIAVLERGSKSGTRRAERADQVQEEGNTNTQLRFSAARFAAQRKKSGLSAAKYAKLLGVSSLSVYKWENGQTRPRRAQLEAIAAARNLGKREAAARLEHLEAAE